MFPFHFILQRLFSIVTRILLTSLSYRATILIKPNAPDVSEIQPYSGITVSRGVCIKVLAVEQHFRFEKKWLLACYSVPSGNVGSATSLQSTPNRESAKQINNVDLTDH